MRGWLGVLLLGDEVGSWRLRLVDTCYDDG